MKITLQRERWGNVPAHMSAHAFRCTKAEVQSVSPRGNVADFDCDFDYMGLGAEVQCRGT